MGGFKGRLGRLEGLEQQGNRCPECGLTPDERRPPVPVYEEAPDKGFQGDPHEACAACGEPLYTVIQVVYDAPAPTRGEGGLLERDVYGH